MNCKKIVFPFLILFLIVILFSTSCCSKPKAIIDIFNKANLIKFGFIGFRYLPSNISDQNRIIELSQIFKNATEVKTNSSTINKYFGALYIYSDSNLIETILLGNTTYYLEKNKITYKHHLKNLQAIFKNGLASILMPQTNSTLKVIFPPEDIFAIPNESIDAIKIQLIKDRVYICRELTLILKDSRTFFDTSDIQFVHPYPSFPLNFNAVGLYDTTYGISSLVANNDSLSIGFFIQSQNRIIGYVKYRKRNNSWENDQIDGSCKLDTVLPWFLNRYSDRRFAEFDAWLYGRYFTIEDKDTINLFAPDGPVRICSPIPGLIKATKTLDALQFVLTHMYPKCIDF